MEVTTPDIATPPRGVTAATLLLYAVAATAVIVALIPVALVDDLKAAAEHAYAGTQLAATAAHDAASLAGSGLVSAFAAAAFWSALAFFCGRGRNPARITVWICGGLTALNVLVGISALPHDFFARRPDWYLPMFIVGIAIRLIGLAAASVLLAVPSSRPFFRKPLPPPIAQASQPTT